MLGINFNFITIKRPFLRSFFLTIVDLTKQACDTHFSILGTHEKVPRDEN